MNFADKNRYRKEFENFVQSARKVGMPFSGVWGPEISFCASKGWTFVQDTTLATIGSGKKIHNVLSSFAQLENGDRFYFGSVCGCGSSRFTGRGRSPIHHVYVSGVSTVKELIRGGHTKYGGQVCYKCLQREKS